MSRPGLAPVKVVVTDDSDIVTSHLVRILEATAQVEVVGVAHSVRELHELVRAKRPDVVTLDLLLPVGTGLAEIARLRKQTQVIVISDTPTDSPLAAEALAQGAIAFVEKRSLAKPEGRARLGQLVLGLSRPLTHATIVAIAGSTGAIPALEVILRGLVELQAPMLVVQHLPSDRVASMTDWLTSIGIRASIATDGAPLTRGNVLIAPGGRHLAVGPREVVRFDDGEPLAGHRPSATVLFESLIPHATKTIAVVLSGMGRDGADAIGRLAAAGGTIVVQRPDTCPVPSMPESALAASHGRGRALAPDAIAPAILRVDERHGHA
jgi:two-component system, chemotaxis family, protein-glutamate methylesterase/glutaminase